jgi:hypothetical protein
MSPATLVNRLDAIINRSAQLLLSFFICLSLCCHVTSKTHYVFPDAAAGGNGSLRKPFNSLSQAEAASQAGDTICLVASESGKSIDGAIRLKAGQKLFGVDKDGRKIESNSNAVRITNTTKQLDGAIIQLSTNNEVAGLHFINLRNHGIIAGDENISGAHLYHNAFTGAVESKEINWSITLQTNAGEVDNVRITDGCPLGVRPRIMNLKS